MKKIISLLVIGSFLFPSVIFANNDFKEINLGKMKDIMDFKYNYDGSNYGFIGIFKTDNLNTDKIFIEKNGNQLDGKKIKGTIQNFYYTKSGALVYTYSGDKNYVVLNGEKQQGYDEILGNKIQFLDNRQDFLYEARDKYSGINQIIKNNETNSFTGYGIYNYKVNGNNYGYTLYSMSNHVYDVIFNGEKVLSIQADGEVPQIYFGKYTNDYAIYTNEGEKHYIYINGIKNNIPASIGIFVFSYDGKHYAYNVLDKIGYIVKDGKKYNLEYDTIDNIILSENGDILIYTGKKDGKSFMSNNFQDKFTGGKVDEIRFSKKGNNITYLSGDRTLVVNGIDTKISNGRHISSIKYNFKYIYYSEDADKYLFIARKDGRQTLYVNGKFINNTYDKIESLNISKTLKNYAFIGIKGKQKYLVLNDTEIDITNYYDSLISIDDKLFFSDDWSKVGIIYKNTNGESILLEIDNSNSEDTKVETAPIQETPKTTQANPQLDKILAPFFERIDKKGDEIAKNTYKTVISKIDIVLQKKLSVKNKNILNYLKEKLEEKIK